MPFMKQGQLWRYDETTGGVVGVKDPDTILLIAEQNAHLPAISAK